MAAIGYGGGFCQKIPNHRIGHNLVQFGQENLGKKEITSFTIDFENEDINSPLYVRKIVKINSKS